MSISSTENVKLGVCAVIFDGVDLGFTKGGVSVAVETSTKEITVDQMGETPIGEVVTARKITADVPLAETTLDNLVAIMPGARLIVDAVDPTKRKVAVSTGININLLSLARTLILRPKNTHGEDDLTIHRAMCPGALTYAYQFDNERVFSAKFNGYSDNAGGLFSIGDDSADGTSPATLADLTLSAASFTAGAAPGTIIGAINGKTAGSTLSVTPNDGRFGIDTNNNLIVGLSASSAGEVDISITETLAGATNTPHSTSLALTVGQGGGDQTIGGITIGTQGTGFRSAYMLMDGADSFSASDFLTPTNHLGRYMTTRAYGNQSGAPKYLRGAGSLAGYEADPWHTGFEDLNRGVVPSSFSDMIQLGDSLKTKARRATSAEKLLMGNLAGKNNLSSMVHMSRRNMMRAPCMLEMSLRFPHSLGSWDANHPTFWLMQDQPASGFDGLELDCEGFAPAFQFNVNRWVNGSQVQNGNPGNTQTTSQTDYRIYSFEVKQNAGVWTAYLYEEGVLVGSTPCSGGSFTFDPTRPFYIMITSHILQSGITQSVWDAAGDAGATIDCDWWRAWGSGTFRKPLKPDVLLKADFNTAFSFDLDTPQAVFGSDVSSDVIAMIPNEDNSPAQPWVRALLPAAITRSGNNIAGKVSDQPGRLITSRSATPAGGDGCIPQAITLCIGPRVVPTTIQYTVGQAFTFDLYAAVDCGDLHMGKQIATSGWPAWATVDIANGLVTGMPTDTGNTTVTISGTNAVGQSVTASVALQKFVAPAYDYMSWNGPLWIDASDTATITQSGGVVSAVANKRTGTSDLAKAGTANITAVANSQNGKNVLRFAVNTSSPARLQAANANTLIDTMQRGNDKPFVMIAVYKPTDTTTGFIAGWSDTVPTADAQQINLVRRSASASSVRRSTTISVTNDVSFGNGQASGGVHIVAISHTGTAISIWDTSTTKAVNGAAQDANTFNSELLFYIGAAETSGGTDPSFAPTVCAMDFMECILETARTDAEIQQAIADLASKWGITLT